MLIKRDPKTLSMLPFFVMFRVEVDPQCHISLQKCLRHRRRKKRSSPR